MADLVGMTLQTPSMECLVVSHPLHCRLQHVGPGVAAKAQRGAQPEMFISKVHAPHAQAHILYV